MKKLTEASNELVELFGRKKTRVRKMPEKSVKKLQKKVDSLKRVGREIPDGKIWKNIKRLYKKASADKEGFVSIRHPRVYSMQDIEGFLVNFDFELIATTKKGDPKKKFKKIFGNPRFGNKIFRQENKDFIVDDKRAEFYTSLSFYAPTEQDLKKFFNSKIVKSMHLPSNAKKIYKAIAPFYK